MIKKLMRIESVGKFKNLGSTNGFQFGRPTLVYAPNGMGKSTLSAILRSLGENSPNLINERLTFSADRPPKVVFEGLNGNSIIFENDEWVGSNPEIAVFDTKFVAENIYSGTEVGMRQRTNLFGFIIDEQKNDLIKELKIWETEREFLNEELKECVNKIPVEKLNGLPITEFCNLSRIPNLMGKIVQIDTQIILNSLRDKFIVSPISPIIKIPEIDMDLIEKVLERSSRLKEKSDTHIKIRKHIDNLGVKSEKWINAGLEYCPKFHSKIEMNCPFCMQLIENNSIKEYNQNYFNKEYTDLVDLIDETYNKFCKSHSNENLIKFNQKFEQISQAYSFWNKNLNLPEISHDGSEILSNWRLAKNVIIKALERKKLSPLISVILTANNYKQINNHNSNCQLIQEINKTTKEIKRSIKSIEKNSDDSDIKELHRKRNKLIASQNRFDPSISQECKKYLDIRSKLDSVNKKIDNIQFSIKNFGEEKMPNIKNKINEFLEEINSNFRIKMINNSRNPKLNRVNYSLQIENQEIVLKRFSRLPKFKNTLSTGDRNILALSFFFARLECSGGLEDKIIVFDDPITSLDEHRINDVQRKICKFSTIANSTLIMSHSKPFLVGLYEKLLNTNKNLRIKTYEIVRKKESSAFEKWSIEYDMLPDLNHMIQDTRRYLKGEISNRKIEIAKSLRIILEEYSKVAYISEYPEDNKFGSFLASLKESNGVGLRNTVGFTFDDLSQLYNDLCEFHHATRGKKRLAELTDDELIKLVTKTLKFMNYNLNEFNDC